MASGMFCFAVFGNIHGIRRFGGGVKKKEGLLILQAPEGNLSVCDFHCFLCVCVRMCEASAAHSACVSPLFLPSEFKGSGSLKRRAPAQAFWHK